MTSRSVMALVLAVILAVSAIEFSSWALGRAVSAVVPSASVSEVDAHVPHTPEVETTTAAAPALTW
jgi:hypothetical protein